jgi:hypothetical protein
VLPLRSCFCRRDLDKFFAYYTLADRIFHINCLLAILAAILFIFSTIRTCSVLHLRDRARHTTRDCRRAICLLLVDHDQRDAHRCDIIDLSLEDNHNSMTKKKTAKTVEDKIDDLALMVGRGLEEVRTEVRESTQATAARFDSIDEGLERIEFQVSGHDRRMTVLEDRVRQLATKVGLSFN